jgi:hypothetical protein
MLFIPASGSPGEGSVAQAIRRSGSLFAIRLPSLTTGELERAKTTCIFNLNQNRFLYSHISIRRYPIGGPEALPVDWNTLGRSPAFLLEFSPKNASYSVGKTGVMSRGRDGAQLTNLDDR